MKIRNVPTRLAAGAYPVIKDMLPTDFLRVLSVGELAVGTALLAPFVPAALAGAALTGFSGALIGTYFRTPALHKPGSIWPTTAGDRRQQGRLDARHRARAARRRSEQELTAPR